MARAPVIFLIQLVHVVGTLGNVDVEVSASGIPKVMRVELPRAPAEPGLEAQRRLDTSPVSLVNLQAGILQLAAQHQYPAPYGYPRPQYSAPPMVPVPTYPAYPRVAVSAPMPPSGNPVQPLPVNSMQPFPVSQGVIEPPLNAGLTLSFAAFPGGAPQQTKEQSTALGVAAGYTAAKGGAQRKFAGWIAIFSFVSWILRDKEVGL